MFAYMDDSRVQSPDRQTHLIYLEALFAALAASGLAISLEKCVFAVPTLKLLGHTNAVAGSAPLQSIPPQSNLVLPLSLSSSCNVFSAW
jgi:hypothetical protein